MDALAIVGKNVCIRDILGIYTLESWEYEPMEITRNPKSLGDLMGSWQNVPRGPALLPLPRIARPVIERPIVRVSIGSNCSAQSAEVWMAFIGASYTRELRSGAVFQDFYEPIGELTSFLALPWRTELHRGLRPR